ncbi:MAG: Smr/MutS family protein [Alphaproteobacteria bacterium]|nr:Smr/MutS family protein [Alphaproteobacteria bacterium]MDE2109629.1 Smr/MutS family protein [Alphaproteobacteria bacterium]MDE2493049.1 Smr/MutS family protein [Alphaproteobacteria bacterium]
MSRRPTTDDERELFRAVISGRAQLKKTKSPASEAKPAAPKKAVTTVPSGVDGRTGERLRRGAVSPDAKLDLHGLTEQAAHRVLSVFLQTAHRRGDRLVLVVTGKGARTSDPHAPFDMELAGRSRGVLKTMVPRWLGEPALSRLIADTRSAHRRHGGEGALYVYLRKTKK